MSKEAEKFIEKYATKDQNDWLVKKKDIIAKFMESYHNEQLRIANVSKSFNELVEQFKVETEMTWFRSPNAFEEWLVYLWIKKQKQ